ncbi:MAG: hypothetical protein CME62_08620 [Halobacteriovoraceae bacterium]|nr:hypothetical protein [Halobacteriovoraceae bacterium]|tara:strand:+ start:15237 stop:16124 length:888 start_codon:yes stop_codon:yes gene_type:complete
MAKIVKLTPYVSETVWGGDKLKQIKNLDATNPVGETWEVASLGEKSSCINNIKLSELVDLSYLVKFIDTTKNLSIQVHPDDEMAAELENSKGKTECWYIMGAEEGAGIYLGFKPNITRKEFFTAVENGLAVDKYLNFIPVARGDFFVVPGGSIHAIGSGITLCEVQQASGITYRVWDWNRMGLDGEPRELHIDKAKQVTNFEEAHNQKLQEFKNLQVESGIFKLIEHADFKVQFFGQIMPKNLSLNLKAKDSLIVLDGELEGDIKLSSFESAIVMEAGTLEFKINKTSTFMVVSE